MAQVDPHGVFQVLSAVTSVDKDVRAPAECVLRRYEREATPGFLLSLLCIVEQKAAPAEARLLAAVVAKNTVGSGVDKTVRNRDWLRIDRSLAKKDKVEGRTSNRAIIAL